MPSVEINGYNTKEKLRCSIQDLPEGIWGHAAIDSTNGTLYCGGMTYTSGGYSTSKKCWRLNDQIKWRKFKPLKSPRSYFTISQINNRLVAVGAYERFGNKASQRNSLEYMDLGSDNDWKEKTLADLYIDHHCSVTFKDQFILLIGGQINGKVNEIT